MISERGINNLRDTVSNGSVQVRRRGTIGVVGLRSPILLSVCHHDLNLNGRKLTYSYL